MSIEFGQLTGRQARRDYWIARQDPSDVVTQMSLARQGLITEEMTAVAQSEKLDASFVRQEVASGRAVIPANLAHANLRPLGIGTNLRCKVNANIGNSALDSCEREELEKLATALKYGADTVMDLSTGGDLDRIRQAIVAASPAPVGTVPIYEAMKLAGEVEKITPELLLEVIEKHARQGVDYMTLHAGLLRRHVELIRSRLLGIVSRGGSLIAHWMVARGEENPLYTRFDDVLAICRRYDVTISLGDGLRPGCLADASDKAQFAELHALADLAERAWEKDVQVMIEGPGHIPFNQVEMNVRKEREICKDAPFYVLGPVVTDVAPGYDHITSAIGATMAAFSGAAMLCYVTPKEHLGLPNAEDVRQGLVAYRIAAHAADVARGRAGARDWDDEMSKARAEFNWSRQFQLAMDPETARSMHDESMVEESLKAADFCSMCGPEFCSMRLSRDLQRKLRQDSSEK
jgi:phosphomethylpyrimidine synthase